MLVFDSIALRLRRVVALAYLRATMLTAPVGDSQVAGKLNGVIR
ncbi:MULTISPECIES: hypothetical protein [unclassified Novosphingobium]|nr:MULTISPECIES: hypothetical protein [unclassified Novosphingobium]